MKVFDSIMSLIKPARIASAAAELGETEHKVTSAVDIILPSLLARMLKKGDTPEIEDVLKDAKHLKVWENYDKIWKGSGIDGHENIGERMENRLLGTHDPHFNAAVGAKAGMKTGNADRLTNWVAGTIGAWFAQKMAGGASYKSLLTDLSDEKAELRKGIPEGIAHELGLTSLLGYTAHKSAPKAAVVHKKKCSLCWLWWLLGILALAAIIFFVWRSCSKKETEEIKTHEKVTVVHNVAPKFTATPMVLPDGTKITMYQGDIEEAIKAFLDSNKFKNATEAELRTVWFEFSDIDFEHNSATALMGGAPARLASLEKVLKGYPDVKMKVGAFADKTGTRAANYAISEKRAETVKAALITAGVPATHIATEGFGKQYANAAASASDAQRAPDRDIAMRFTK